MPHVQIRSWNVERGFISAVERCQAITRQPSESLERPSKTQAFLVVALGFSHSSPNVLSTVLSISQLSESQVSKSRHRLLKNAHMMAIACFFDIGVGVREVTSETLWLITPDHLSNWKTSYKCAPKLRFCKTRDGKWTCREGIEKITVVQGLWCPRFLTPPHLQTMLYSRFRRHRWKNGQMRELCELPNEELW